MVAGVSLAVNKANYGRLVKDAPKLKANVQFVEGLGLDQKDRLIQFMSRAKMESLDDVMIFNKAQALMNLNKPEEFWNGIRIMKQLVPEQAEAIQTSKGIAIMAEGWDKPIVFPENKGFKWIGWADHPEALKNSELWSAAYGKEPGVIMGAVGNSNIKPEQVINGCTLSKKELSAMYEASIENFYKPILRYFEEIGVKADDIGFAFAHSDCGVDRAARNVAEKFGLKGFGTTPTTYTQYLRGVEKEATAEFPNGYIEADFPFPTVLTRGLMEINDYAHTYGKLVGKNNPVAIFGGGEHAFYKDAKETIFEKDGAIAVPYDIVKEQLGYEIPGMNEKGVVTNAARYYLEKVNGNPYEKYRKIFDSMPSSPLKEEIKQNDAQMAVTSIMYSKLKGAGKIK